MQARHWAFIWGAIVGIIAWHFWQSMRARKG